MYLTYGRYPYSNPAASLRALMKFINHNDFLYYLFRNREGTTSYAKAKFIGMLFEAEKEIDIAAIAQ